MAMVGEKEDPVTRRHGRVGNGHGMDNAWWMPLTSISWREKGTKSTSHSEAFLGMCIRLYLTWKKIPGKYLTFRVAFQPGECI